MEDYYNSAFYFNGGNFYSDAAGSTHHAYNGSAGIAEWSGYRIHDGDDPVAFQVRDLPRRTPRPAALGIRGLHPSAALAYPHPPRLDVQDGMRFTWRNGDTVDPSTGMKCTLKSGGKTVGHPTASHATTYAWVYTWPSERGSAVR